MSRHDDGPPARESTDSAAPQQGNSSCVDLRHLANSAEKYRAAMLARYILTERLAATFSAPDWADYEKLSNLVDEAAQQCAFALAGEFIGLDWYEKMCAEARRKAVAR